MKWFQCLTFKQKFTNIYIISLLSDRPGLKGLAEITRLSQAVQRALRIEMDRTHPQPIKGDVTVCDAMLAKIPVLRFVLINQMIFFF